MPGLCLNTAEGWTARNCEQSLGRGPSGGAHCTLHRTAPHCTGDKATCAGQEPQGPLPRPARHRQEQGRRGRNPRSARTLQHQTPLLTALLPGDHATRLHKKPSPLIPPVSASLVTLNKSRGRGTEVQPPGSHTCNASSPKTLSTRPHNARASRDGHIRTGDVCVRV